MVLMGNHGPWRARRMAQLARRMQCKFLADGRELLHEWFARFPLFQAGKEKSLYNAISGRYRDAEVVLFDYAFANTYHRRQSVVAFKLNAGRISRFAMWPRDKSVTADLSISGHEEEIAADASDEFAERFAVYTNNAEATRALFHPRVQRFLGEQPSWSVEGGGEWLVVYQLDRQPSVRGLSQYLWEAYQVFRAFKLR